MVLVVVAVVVVVDVVIQVVDEVVVFIEKSYQNRNNIPVGFNWMVAFVCLDLILVFVI